MSETRTVHDPFLGKDVQISNRLVDRLRGKYASGPTLPNGEPEFGWRQFETPPIQHEAADTIEALAKALQPFAGEKMPSLGRSKIDYDKNGLRRCISPMEIACRDALRALSRVGLQKVSP
jgi:hypothetical protein